MSVKKILVEDFDILNNGENFALAFQLDDGMVFDVDFMYDGRNCAILTRNKEKAFLFTNILPNIREMLNAADKIIIFEEKGKEVVNAYEVKIKHVENIPYPDDFNQNAEKLMNQLKEKIGEKEFNELITNIVNEYNKTKK